MDSFTVKSVIRGYHIYEEVWSSVIGEVLVCHCNTRNCHDPFAVATCKGTTVPDLTKALWDQARRYPFKILQNRHT